MMGKLRKFISSELGVGLLACASLLCVGAVAASRASSGAEVSPDAVADLYGACSNYTSTSLGCDACYPTSGYLSMGTGTTGTAANIGTNWCATLNGQCGQYMYLSTCSQGM